MNGNVIFWLTAAILSTAALTALIVAPLAARWATARAEHLAEHDIVQAVLWADNPLDVLRFYARYTPWPVWPAPDTPEPPPDDEPEQARPLVRPAVPEPGASTSHRRQRRPFIGWLEETFKPRPAGDQANVAEGGTESSPPLGDFATILPAVSADPDPDTMPADIPVAPDAKLASERDRPLGLLDDICPRCAGATRLPGTLTATAHAPIWNPCPDCCCTWPGCGLFTGGGFCPAHQHADELDEESAAKRTADV